MQKTVYNEDVCKYLVAVCRHVFDSITPKAEFSMGGQTPIWRVTIPLTPNTIFTGERLEMLKGILETLKNGKAYPAIQLKRFMVDCDGIYLLFGY